MQQVLIRWFSGFQRSLRATTLRRGFQPIRKSFAPAFAARFASTDAAKDGKIHQVIGAVVE